MPTQPGLTLGEVLVAKAKTALGRPYVWGATGPDGFDCSGLVNWAAAAVGIKGLPRTSQAIRNVGRAVPVSQIGIGDLVTFTYADRRGGNPGPGNHVAIYAGGGQVVQASGSKVNVGPLDTAHIDRVIRLPQAGAGGVVQVGLEDMPAGAGGTGARVMTMQQAGYGAEAKTGPYGAPVNPFKLAGWIASGSSEAAQAPGGVVQAGLGEDLMGGGGVPWDGVSTMVLSAVFVLGGVVLVVVGAAVSIRSAGGAE